MTEEFDPNEAASADAGIFGRTISPHAASVVLVPVPFAATTSYGGGAERGPRAILRASHQVDLFDIECGKPYAAGVAMLPIDASIEALHARARSDAERVIDVGGRIGDSRELRAALARVNASSAELNAWVYEQCGTWLRAGKLVGLVGGDHSTPFGAIRAVSERFAGVGILHIDAHADLRERYEGFDDSHASIMFNVRKRLPEVGPIVQVGIRDFCEAEYSFIQGSEGAVVTHFDAALADEMMRGTPWQSLAERIVDELPRDVYVSFDIDGLDPALCPHTGTPVPGGLTFHQACALIRTVVRSGRRIVGFDVNEVVPGPDGDEWDANVGARVLYKLVGWALESRGEARGP